VQAPESCASSGWVVGGKRFASSNFGKFYPADRCRPAYLDVISSFERNPAGAHSPSALLGKGAFCHQQLRAAILAQKNSGAEDQPDGHVVIGCGNRFAIRVRPRAPLPARSPVSKRRVSRA